MPLIYQHQINETDSLGVWHITEAEDFFLQRVPLQRSITHPHKRLQHLAGRCLLTELVPDFPHELIRIADTRKPFLANEAWHFSLSHCGDYAAAIVSPVRRVGVDVELVSEKVARVRHKFLTNDELRLTNDEQIPMTDDRGSRTEGQMNDERRTTNDEQGTPNTQYQLPNTELPMTVDRGSRTEGQANDELRMMNYEQVPPAHGQRPTANEFLPPANASQLSTINYQLLTACWSIKEALFKWQGTGEIDFRQHLRIDTMTIRGNEGEAACRILKDGEVSLQARLLFFDNVCLSWVMSE